MNNAILGVALFEIFTTCSTWRSCGTSIVAARSRQRPGVHAVPVSRRRRDAGAVSRSRVRLRRAGASAAGHRCRRRQPRAGGAVRHVRTAPLLLRRLHLEGPRKCDCATASDCSRDGDGTWALRRGMSHAVKWVPFAFAVGWFGWAQRMACRRRSNDCSRCGRGSGRLADAVGTRRRVPEAERTCPGCCSAAGSRPVRSATCRCALSARQTRSPNSGETTKRWRRSLGPRNSTRTGPRPRQPGGDSLASQPAALRRGSLSAGAP